ncbi:Pre-mRNA-splicing factor cwf10 [Candida viswanathii]|uniref:Pre-mRNA-splicing factor cwf10 n=1 Tax=Candida viswanathii TaxID=5486 RepID=A0A367XN90_9ASCO|nr:Pre-mRNA-splicing factor cwf10 [Candida viswanathii]
MDSDDDLYDEFGNYIGGSDAENSNDDLPSLAIEHSDNEEEVPVQQSTSTSLIKSTIQSTAAETIYIGQDQEISNDPVIQPVIDKKMKVEYTTATPSSLPELTYSREYLISTMNSVPDRIRNVAVLGNLGSGKTTFIDSLVLVTHALSISTNDAPLKGFKPLRFLDTHKLEIEREASIKSCCVSLLLEDMRGRSHVMNVVDTPGHVDFNDEVLAGLNTVDGAVLVIDVVLGLTTRDKLLVDEIIRNDLPVVVVLNKLDKLILDLRLPVKDAYLKLQYIVDEINDYIESHPLVASYTNRKDLSPELNNVVFASSVFEISFTLQSFAQLYDSEVDFSGKLWGEYYYDAESHKFTMDSRDGKLPRLFIAFVLEPVYKIVTYTITAEPSDKKLAKLLWDNFGVSLHKAEYKEDPQVLLKSVFKAIFDNHAGFVLAVALSLPSPQHANTRWLRGISAKDIPVEVLGEVTKLIESPDGKKFNALVRIHKGSVKVGDRVKVYGDNFNEDKEDYKVDTIKGIYLPGGRYNVPLEEANPGAIVIIEGIDSVIKKGATITSSSETLDYTFDTPKYSTNSVFKVAIEPENPSELPILLEGLRKINKSYLSSVINVEESGEHVILSPGEFYMDCILHDLRFFFTNDLEIKVSDVMAKFSETCTVASFTKISIANPSNDFRIAITAEPLDDFNLSQSIESGHLNLDQMSPRELSKILRLEFNWDSLASRSVWAFGPSDLSTPDILLDDTFESETPKVELNNYKSSIIQGFKWSVNQGPLCDEPIRNTKFKILDVITNNTSSVTSSQIIPMSRRACYTGFLTAQPRLMEPIYQLASTCTHKAINVIRKLLQQRRGFVDSVDPVPGTPYFEVLGYVPVIESVGLTTDLKSHTLGQAVLSLVFSNWDVVPGDPLDVNAELPSLKPVPELSLARDFMLKTRRRKGLTGEPTLQKYIDSDLYLKLKEKGFVL